MNLRSHGGILIVGSALCFAPACGGSEPALTPAAAAVESRHGADAATATQQDVQLTVETGWSGDDFIQQKVTPLRISLSNHSNAEVHVRYSDFGLVNEQRRWHAALPVVLTRGVVASKGIPGGVDSDRFEPGAFRAFRYAPYYSTLDPNIEVYRGAFERDERYYTNYGPRARETQLPTRDMVKVALPEGVLMPGGYVSGYLYFQKIDTADDQVWLRANLPTSGEDVEASPITFQIPFVVR